MREKNTRVKVAYVGSCQRIFPPAGHGGLRTVWRLFKKFPHGFLTRCQRRVVFRHWAKMIVKSSKFYNWASFSHRQRRPMCAQGFPLPLVFFFVTVARWEIAEGTRGKTKMLPTRGSSSLRELAIIIITSFPGSAMVISSGQVVNAHATPTR